MNLEIKYFGSVSKEKMCIIIININQIKLKKASFTNFKVYVS